MADISTNIFEAVEGLVSRQLDSTPIDLTVTATVALIRNVEIGEYKVNYKGDTFSAFSLDPLTVYNKGEEVYVLVPKGNFSAKKIILGKAAYNDKVSYADRQAMSNQWKTRGPNWLSNEWYWRADDGSFRTDNDAREAGIIATKMGEEHLITSPDSPDTSPPPSWREYVFFRDADTNPVPNEPTLTAAREEKTLRPLTANRPSLEALQQVDAQFQNYSNVYEHVMISANFETNFSSIHSSGEYGILVECWAENPKFGKENYPDAPERLLTTLRFSFNDFNGAPYQFNQSTPQRAVFPVPKGVLKGLVRVCLFQDDGWNTDVVPIYIKTPSPEVSYDVAKGATPVRDRNNIFATGIDIRWCENINLSENLFWMRVDTPRGTSLYNASDTSPGNPSIPLEARLFYGSTEITAKETCKFIWFRQKYSATMDKVDKDRDKDEFGRTWWDYGGNGWAPIDKIMADPADEPFFGESANGVNQYSFNDPDWHQVLNVGIDVVPWQWRYKVVCVYNPTAQNIEDKLERGNKEVILFETELVTNESSLHYFDLPLPIVSNDLLTTYLRPQNLNLPWVDGEAYDPQNPDYPDPGKDWWCRWWMETPSGLYEPVPHTGTPRFQKGKININDYLHYDAITFKAQIFGKKTPTGATKEDRISDAAQVWAYPDGVDQTAENNEYEIANIERTLLKSEDLLLLVDWDGVTHHSYNSDGSILLENSVGSEFFLRAILHWSDSSIMDYAIEWIAPDGVTPLRHHSIYPGGDAVGTGFNMSESMMYDMWVGADNIVRYKVHQKYDINKTKNTLTLRVTLIDGRVFNYSKEITFSKAGQNGTQGSDWEARIWPTNPEAVINTSGMPGFESWTEEIRKYPRPLVVNGNFDGTSESYTRNDNYRLFLRPFIYKNGKRIEELADEDNYSYKVYWDARYPNVKDTSLTARYAARQNSFFEFASTGSPIDNPDGYLFGATNPVGIPNLQAVTRHDDVAGSAVRTYGSIEVKWRNEARINGVSVKDINYDFVIRAQVDIYKQDVLIATIFSYWPIDVLFTNGNTVTPTIFNPNLINTNWPQFVMYNPTGYGPETNQDYLRFFYGEKAWNQFDPLPYSATPMNLTPTVQEIRKEQNFVPKSWRLYPRPYYFFEECANGSMYTDFTLDPDFMPPDDDPRATSTEPNTDTGWVSPNPDMDGWNQCTYVRPVVYMLNSFGNTDINGWDGKSIDINDERGTIFAPTIGAGWKDPFTNKFSGVLMGIDTSQSKQTYKNIFGGFSQDDINKNPFMTGLFGYQDGVSSFGILENGTAYFGRADRGGRIIIDGFNAQIFGGLQGDINGGRDMDMHNRMRLSFIDFEGVAHTQGIGDVDGSDTDPDAERKYLDTDGVKINTGSYNVGDDAPSYNRFFPYFANTDSPTSLIGQYAGFGSGRGAGTPAIEIGSYKNYIDSGGVGSDLIRKITPEESQSWYGRIMDLEIPGYRKFLVTYDGTLYAMNAFIKGNIIGSNIIGSQFFNHDGSWGVDETGNQWSGSGKSIFREYFVEDYGEWSHTPPSIGPARGVSFILAQEPGLYTGLDPNPRAREVYDQIDAPFFVANDGRVFCQEIHISGRSSINIGGFHVVPYGSSGNMGGDMFSFGTSYFIGGYGGTPNMNTTAVEGWGAFYLRGKLTNLGPVYLGGTPEKTKTGTYSATSFNSPFSMEPDREWGSLNSKPGLPVRMGMWPLYFHIDDGALTTQSNRAWVCFSSNPGAFSFSENINNGYMPAFSLRKGSSSQYGPAIIPNDGSEQAGQAVLGRHVVWRIDQLGQWTDGIFFTRSSWVQSPTDTQALDESHALLYMGWGEFPAWSQSQPDLGGFLIRNVCRTAPNTVIEVPNVLRLTAGRWATLRGSNPKVSHDKVNTVLIDTFKEGTNDRKASIAASGKDDALVGNAHTIALSGLKRSRQGSSLTGFGDIQCFIALNALGWPDSFGESLVYDERRQVVSLIPTRTDEDTSGYIWIKGRTTVIDAHHEATQVTSNISTAQVRLNRTYDGNASSIPAPPTGDAIPSDPSGSGVLSGFVGIRGEHAVNIRADNWIRIELGSRSLVLTKTELRVSNVPAEEQFGIYARFA